MKLNNYIVIIFIICFYPDLALSQIDSLQTEIDSSTLKEKLLRTGLDTLGKPSDEAIVPKDSLKNAPAITNSNPGSYEVSSDSLPKPVIYGAVDTQWYEHKTKLMHLYGDAYVKYENMELKAGYIVLNIESNVAEAKYIEPIPGVRAQRPIFNDGNKDVTYNHLKYNFKTKRGIVYEAISTEGDLYLHGARTKYVGADGVEEEDDDVIYNANTLITTCNHEHPHFGFRTRKLKLIPDKIAVMGPANLELGGVPTPFWIPYGFFPLVKGKSSGFIFPNDYEYSPNLGFGLRGFGWYFPVNDYLNITVRGDLYTRGTHGVNVHLDYKKKYKYTGDIFLGYDNRVTEIPDSVEKLRSRQYSVNITHNQDAKAHPYVKIGGSVNFETNNYGQVVYNEAAQVLNNTYSSNFNYSHSLPTLPWRFSLGFRHSQNTQNREMDITFPDINFLMNRVNPFKRKNRGGNTEAWYEKIVFSYDVRMKNLIETTDTTLFTKEVLNNMKSGISHETETSLSFKVLKYFSLNTSFNYDELWMFQENGKFEGSERIIAFVDTDPDTGDTLEIFYEDIPIVVDTSFNAFNTFRTYDARVTLNTQIFGTLNMSKGWLRGVRHTIKPSIGFSMSPDTRGMVNDTLVTDAVNEGFVSYSRFPTQPFRASARQRSMSLNYGFVNLLELKHYSKRDSTIKKFKPFDRLTINGNYNFAADSLNWSTITANSDTRLFKGTTVLTFRATWDPYLENASNRRINTTVLSENNRLVRLDNATIKLTNTLTVKKLGEIFGRKKKENDRTPSETDDEDDIDVEDVFSGSNISTRPPGITDEEEERGRNKEKEDKKNPEISLIDWLQRIRIRHEFTYNYTTQNNIGESSLIHSLAISGDVDLTDNWNLRIGNLSYDFINKGLGYPSFTFTRKLHCWNMQFTWQPNRETYSFFIGVTSNTLNFLKYNYGQNNIDGGILGRRF